MISNQILQSTIEGIKSISRVELCVADVDGKEIVSTSPMGDFVKAVGEFALSPADSQEIQGKQYFKIYDEQQLEYILIVSGVGEDVYTVGKMATFHIQSLLVAYKERFDKDNFIKNLLLDNLLLVDIYSRAKKLHIQAEVRRVAMIVEAENDKENNVLEIIRTNMNAGNKDFITAVDENNVIVVKDLSEGDSVKDIEKAAKNIIATLEKDGLKNVRVA